MNPNYIFWNVCRIKYFQKKYMDIKQVRKIIELEGNEEKFKNYW
jgi:DNA-binding transcriptional MerR regulator